MIGIADSSVPQAGLPAAAPLRAAQYVRMSTEHQRYSTENQIDAITQYATRHGFEVVQTYADHGKSGLSIEGRKSLRQLISDVENRHAQFKAVLVYDVSRWGRFQDADESAYYEYLCRRAGIEIRYCAEQFENDGSIASTIVKTVKRAMAGEYSRELSTKVFAGQCRLVELGYRQGGIPGYALRRRLIDQNGTPKGLLGLREQKNIQTDRVVLELGPEEEVETVRWMFRMYVEKKKTQTEIAEALNEQDIKTSHGRRWVAESVRSVLSNEKYIGNNVFNRVSFKLKKKRVFNPPDMWVRAAGAFPAIVSEEMFLAAQSILARRRLTNDEMLERLKGLYCKTGALSALIIDEADGLPSSHAYRHRFGGLTRAYQLAGCAHAFGLSINRMLRSLHPELVNEVIETIRRRGGSIEQDEATGLLIINKEFSVSMAIASCTKMSSGYLRWKVRFDTALRPDITIAPRIEPETRRALDYYLLPRLDMATAQFGFAEQHDTVLEAYRFESLDKLFELAARTTVGRAA